MTETITAKQNPADADWWGQMIADTRIDAAEQVTEKQAAYIDDLRGQYRTVCANQPGLTRNDLVDALGSFHSLSADDAELAVQFQEWTMAVDANTLSRAEASVVIAALKTLVWCDADSYAIGMESNRRAKKNIVTGRRYR